MWSAIPVALLCMIVKWSERKQGSGSEGDFCLSFHPSIRLFPQALSGLKSVLTDSRPERVDFSPPVFYRTLSPSGSLPCFPSLQFIITQSRATGIADHILPLGDLLIVQ